MILLNNGEYIHFGVVFNEEKTSKYMTKNNFVNRNLKQNMLLTDYAKNKALNNYDLNMKYFDNLNHTEFDNELNKLLNIYAFVKINDLNFLKGRKGIYILVLDNYKQIYIGQTNHDLKNRIIRHFTIEIPFQRVPFVRYNTLPIDAFKPLDITRIYTLYSSEQNILDEFESKLINKCNKKYLLNKTIGGKANNYMDLAIRLSIGRIKKDIEKI